MLAKMDDPREEKSKELKLLQSEHQWISYENSMLSEHLMRVVMARKASLRLHLEKLGQEQDEKDAEGTKQPRKGPAEGGGKSLVRFSQYIRQPEVAAPLSTEEKCDIAEEECKYLAQHQERIRDENDRVLDDLRAIISQAQLMIAEVRKDRSDFTRDVLLLGELSPNQKACSEDVMRFINEKIRKKQIMRTNISNRNEKLLAETKLLESQFANKKDLKDLLHAVDFDQLKILNGQLNTRHRDRNNEIQRLKSLMKHSLRTSSGTQRELVSANHKGRRVRQNLVTRSPVIPKTSEAIGVEKVVKNKCFEAVLTALQEQDGPPQARATDYMKTRDRATQLRKEMSTWYGKVEIAELTNKELEKTWKVLQREVALQGLVV